MTLNRRGFFGRLFGAAVAARFWKPKTRTEKAIDVFQPTAKQLAFYADTRPSVLWMGGASDVSVWPGFDWYLNRDRAKTQQAMSARPRVPSGLLLPSSKE